MIRYRMRAQARCHRHRRGRQRRRCAAPSRRRTARERNALRNGARPAGGSCRGAAGRSRTRSRMPRPADRRTRPTSAPRATRRTSVEVLDAARPRADRARPGQDPHPRDRGAAARRPAAQRGRAARLDRPIAAHVLHRQSRHRQDDGGDADGRRSCTGSATSRSRVSSPVTRDDLVGQYVGHTAPKTKEVLRRAYGGVLFIDEAYYLYRPENERDYGQEAIEILLQVMEAERDKLVVIFAGYKDRMDDFFRSNPGMQLARRAPHRLPRLRRRRADGDRRPDDGPAELQVRRGRRGRVPRLPRAPA